MIGDDIEITVVDIRGDRVRLGITAPQSVSVHRKEVYEAIRRENIEASRTKVQDLSQLDSLLGGPPKPEEEDKDKKQKPNNRGGARKGDEGEKR